MREVTGCDQVLVRGRARIVGLGRGVRKPVPEVETRSPEVIGARFAAHVFHPGFHAFVLGFKDACIAIDNVEIPGDDNRGIRPTRGAGSAFIGSTGNHVGHDVWNSAAWLLIPAMSLSHFAKKV